MNMKRRTLMLTAVIMLSSLLAACSGKGGHEATQES